jgi:hypothetical protein
MAHVNPHEMPLRSAGCGWSMVFAALLLLAEGAPALSQSPPPPAGQAAPQAIPQSVPQGQAPAEQGAPLPPAAPPPAAEPRKPDDFFDQFNRWWDKSAADFKQSLEDQNAKWRELNAKSEKAAKDAAAASREAAEAFKSLSNARMVEGRRVCEIAANGSPDCQTAAETLCRSKGFKTGKSADITTSRKCSIRGMLHRDSSECKVETIMIKAACQ